MARILTQARPGTSPPVPHWEGIEGLGAFHWNVLAPGGIWSGRAPNVFLKSQW
jgi:hypothetical protein